MTRRRNQLLWPVRRQKTPYNIGDCGRQDCTSQSLAVAFPEMRQRLLRTTHCTQRIWAENAVNNVASHLTHGQRVSEYLGLLANVENPPADEFS